MKLPVTEHSTRGREKPPALILPESYVRFYAQYRVCLYCATDIRHNLHLHNHFRKYHYNPAQFPSAMSGAENMLTATLQNMATAHNSTSTGTLTATDVKLGINDATVCDTTSASADFMPTPCTERAKQRYFVWYRYAQEWCEVPLSTMLYYSSMHYPIAYTKPRG